MRMRLIYIKLAYICVEYSHRTDETFTNHLLHVTEQYTLHCHNSYVLVFHRVDDGNVTTQSNKENSIR